MLEMINFDEKNRFRFLRSLPKDKRKRFWPTRVSHMKSPENLKIENLGNKSMTRTCKVLDVFLECTWIRALFQALVDEKGAQCKKVTTLSTKPHKTFRI